VMYDIDLTLRNDTDDSIEVVIPKGSIFEGTSTGPGWPQQNLAIAREYRITLGPRMRVTLHMEARCINFSFPAPRNWPMRPTVFVWP
jgi:hypothetical protein